ncbi:hypothetical protein LINPERPRIM_LOCUS13666 [Linum perenne]
MIVNWASTRTLPSRQSKVPYSLTRPADIYSSVIVLQFTSFAAFGIPVIF